MKHSDKITDEPCPRCESSNLQQVLTAIANYQIHGDNSASTRPKGGGSK